MKKKILSLLFLFFVMQAFTDETDDSLVVNKTLDARYQKEKFKIKFRGSLSFVFTYMFEQQDGVRRSDKFSPITSEPIDYTAAEDPHHSPGDKGRVIGGQWGGVQAKLYGSYGVVSPMLNFDTPLTKDNNIRFNLLAEISPITANWGASMVLTPIAFLQFQFGFLVGSGWALSSTLGGIGLNEGGTIHRASFQAPMIQFWFTPTFQMDLAYVVPKRYQRWLHIVAIASPQLKFQNYFGAGYHQPYMYEECAGEQLNGWRLGGDFIFGYRFYINEEDTGEGETYLKMNHKNFIITLAAYAWIDWLNLSHYHDSTMASGGWGSDFMSVNFGPAIQLDLPYHLWVKLFFFFRNERAYTDATVGNADFRNRVYEDYLIYPRTIGIFIGWNF